MDNIIFILFGIVIFIGIIMLVLISSRYRRPKGLDQDYYRRRVSQIEGLLENGDHDAHIAILNADKLLDSAMQASGFKGNTLGERLKYSPKGRFSSYQAIWAAHKLRNRIAHENDVVISSRQARKVIGTYKKALRDLGAI